MSEPSANDSDQDFQRVLRPDEIKFGQQYYGQFRCERCCRAWGSARTWKNKYQPCQNCKMTTYPHTMVCSIGNGVLSYLKYMYQSFIILSETYECKNKVIYK